jgi:hypothetical protein
MQFWIENANYFHRIKNKNTNNSFRNNITVKADYIVDYTNTIILCLQRNRLRKYYGKRWYKMTKIREEFYCRDIGLLIYQIIDNGRIHLHENLHKG